MLDSDWSGDRYILLKTKKNYTILQFMFLRVGHYTECMRKDAGFIDFCFILRYLGRYLLTQQLVVVRIGRYSRKKLLCSDTVPYLQQFYTNFNNIKVINNYGGPANTAVEYLSKISMPVLFDIVGISENSCCVQTVYIHTYNIFIPIFNFNNRQVSNYGVPANTAVEQVFEQNQYACFVRHSCQVMLTLTIITFCKTLGDKMCLKLKGT